MAQLNGDLKEAQLKNLGLRAKLILDGTDVYDMDINNGVATWQNAELPTQSPYDVTVKFELEFVVGSGPDSGKYALVAQANASHDFLTEPTKIFQVSDLSSEFHADRDGMTNLAEMLVGGNPFNEAPTVLSAAQTTVLENSSQVMTVEAISPRAASMQYSIILDESALFIIDSVSGLLSFENPITYGPNTDGNNQYRVTIRVDDGSFTLDQTIAVTVTDVFDLKVDIGLKQLQFRWIAAPNASYYKILQSNDAGASFKELPTSGTITSLSYTHSLAVHRFDPVNTQFKLQAYNSNNVRIAESDAIRVTADLNDAIGYVKSARVTKGDQFGRAVAVSADGNTLIVGASREGRSDGAVHVYSRATGVWRHQGRIKAPNGDASDFFGSSVAVSADGNTLVVGADGEASAARGINDTKIGPDDNSIPYAGAVYVFDRTKTVDAFVFQDYIKAPNSNEYSWFGSAIALSIDGNTLVVGAWGEDSAARGITDIIVDPDDNSAPESGAVYVYDRAGRTDTFAFRDYVKAPNSDAYDFFGTAVAVSADGNTLVVGAYGEASAARSVNDTTVGQDDNSARFAGAVYVFDRISEAGEYAFRDYAKASNSDSDDQFGSVVAVSADGNTLVVGAYKEASSASGINDITVGQRDNSAGIAGAVYVYDRTSNAAEFDLQAYVKAPNSDSGDRFGNVIALSADSNTLVVGAWGEGSAALGINDITVGLGDNSARFAGAVYVYDRTNRAAEFDLQAYVKAPNSNSGDRFGGAVALSSDGSTLVVGARDEDSAARGINDTKVGSADNSVSNAGVVYLY